MWSSSCACRRLIAINRNSETNDEPFSATHRRGAGGFDRIAGISSSVIRASSQSIRDCAGAARDATTRSTSASTVGAGYVSTGGATRTAPAAAPTLTPLPEITVTAPPESACQGDTTAASRGEASDPDAIGGSASNRNPQLAPAGTQPATRPVKRVPPRRATGEPAFDSARVCTAAQDGRQSFALSQDAISCATRRALNTPIDKVLLQVPGVSQDTAASGDLHIRNEHGNIGYRVNGIILPDGVSGLRPVPRNRFRREPQPAHRRAAGPIRA